MLLNRGAARRSRACGRLLLWAAAVAGMLLGAAAQAQPVRPEAAVLLDKLCAHTMRPNEEDRLFGMISLTVRTTIKYEGGVFDPDLIDDSMQDALGDLLASCSQLAAIGDPYRLGRAVDLIHDATLKRLQDSEAGYSESKVAKATAADLSEELSAQEIDAWLNALPPRRRVLALFLYASNLTDRQMADAIGLAPTELAVGFQDVKTSLLKFFRADPDAIPFAPQGSDATGPALEYRLAGPSIAELLRPDPKRPAPPTARIRITGISPDFYAGWSLLATVNGVPPEETLEIPEPILIEPDEPGHRRMIVVAADEITDPHARARQFLLKAYAVDADKDGATLEDSFHLVAAKIDNPEALLTLHNRSLAAIEVARCLWHDYGTAADPGMCR